MTRVERLEEALQAAQAFICVMKKSVGLSSGRIQELALEAQGKISTILMPPPAYEDVEVVQWAVVAPSGFVEETFSSEATAESAVSGDGIWSGYEVTKLTGTYKRPLPSPVEKMAHGTASADGVVQLDGAQPTPGTRCVVMWEEGRAHKGSPRDKVWILNDATLIEDKEGACRWIRIAPFPDYVPTNKVGTLTYTWQEDQ